MCLFCYQWSQGTVCPTFRQCMETVHSLRTQQRQRGKVTERGRREVDFHTPHGILHGSRDSDSTRALTGRWTSTLVLALLVRKLWFSQEKYSMLHCNSPDETISTARSILLLSLPVPTYTCTHVYSSRLSMLNHAKVSKCTCEMNKSLSVYIHVCQSVCMYKLL